MKKIDKIIITIVFLLAIIVASIISIQASNCTNSGGEFVRGVFWFKCIN